MHTDSSEAICKYAGFFFFLHCVNFIGTSVKSMLLFLVQNAYVLLIGAQSGIFMDGPNTSQGSPFKAWIVFSNS